MIVEFERCLPRGTLIFAISSFHLWIHLNFEASDFLLHRNTKLVPTWLQGLKEMKTTTENNILILSSLFLINETSLYRDLMHSVANIVRRDNRVVSSYIDIRRNEALKFSFLKRYFNPSCSLSLVIQCAA